MMKPPWKLPFWLGVIAGSALAGSAAAQTPEEVSLKEVEVAERNAAGEDIQNVDLVTAEPGPLHRTIQLGQPPTYANSIGEPAFATGYVNDEGTFWVGMNADNNDPMFRDNGNAFSSVVLQYLMRKESETESPFFELTGGQLHLVDYGGGVSPLETFVTVRAWTADADSSDPWDPQFHGYAQLSGRGGTPATETFYYDFRGFDITPDDYEEVETRFVLSNGDEVINVHEAVLTIPSQVIPIDLGGICLFCEFYLEVEAFGYANNPGGESAASTYLRDPLHLDDADPTVGGASLHFAGVTVLPWVPRPAPEPAPLALAALALTLLTTRSITVYPARRWFARASSSPRR